MAAEQTKTEGDCQSGTSADFLWASRDWSPGLASRDQPPRSGGPAEEGQGGVACPSLPVASDFSQLI